MTVLTIRANKRYAVRQTVRLGTRDSAPAYGLLIELSSEGCRISNLGRAALAVGEPVTIDFDQIRLPGHIRWGHDGIAGVRFEKALRSSELAEMIALGRGEPAGDVRRYGT